MRILLKRTYEVADKADGFRVLADRLWPRGIKKENLELDDWAKDFAPSTDLRKTYHSGELSYEEFSKKYEQELKNNPDFGTFFKTVLEHPVITLLTSSKEIELSALPTLKHYLEKQQ